MADASRLIRRLADLLPLFLLSFVASAFALPNDPSYSLVFYVLVAPATLAFYRVHGAGALRGSAIRLALLLVAWSAATLLWGQDDGHRTLRFARDSTMTLLFVLAMAASLQAPPTRRRLGDVLVGVGTANATLSIAISLLGHPLGPRLVGWGATTNPVLGASVMTVCFLTALSRFLLAREHRAPDLAAATVMAAFVLLTESRGPLLAAFLGAAILCALSPWRWWALALAGSLASAWPLLPGSLQNHQARLLVGRGTSHHLEIWQRTLRLVADRPLFGHGLAANLDVPGLTFPHNLYLSLLFYSGAVGLALFLALATACAWRLARLQKGGQERAWLGVLCLAAVLAGMTDLGQITKGPGPIWFILWLPAGLLLTARPASPDAQQPGTLGA